MSADAERRAIVEWIRSGAGPYVEGYGDEIADAIERGEHFAAQGIAAPTGGKTGTGLTVGKSPTPLGDAPERSPA